MTTGPTRIRRATRDDIESIAQLIGILFSEEHDFLPDIDKQRRGVERIVTAPERGVILMAESDQGIVGSCCLLWTESTFLGTAAAWLEDVIVHPDYRGSGLGKQLVQAALAAAREHGCMRVNLITDADNVRAQHVYTQNGFVRSQMVLFRNYF